MALGYALRGAGLGLGGGDGDGDGLLVVEADGEGSGFAVIPGVLGDGEVEEDEAFGGLAGVDLSFAVERGFEFFVCARFELGEGGVEVGDICFLDGAGGDGFSG